MGLGSGLVFTPCTTAVGLHFRHRRSLALGLSLTGSSVGAVAFPISERFICTQVSCLYIS